MSLGMSMRVRHKMATEIRISQEVRVEISQRIFGLRMELIQTLRQERYDPRGECPHCGKKLKAVEILRGFNRDPNDFTTKCVKCGTRFQPSLICFGKETSVTLPFWCDTQVLYYLKGKENLSPEELALKEPAIYRSAIVHHGSIRGAFAKIGIKYQFDEVLDWRHLILPFLGKMPDTMIAECVGTSVGIVRRMRRKADIPRFYKRKLAAEFED